MPFVPFTIREFVIRSEQPLPNHLLVDLMPDVRPFDGWTVLPIPLSLPFVLADTLGGVLRQQAQRLTTEQRKREQQERAEAMRARNTTPGLSSAYLSDVIANADSITRAMHQEINHVPLSVANELAVNVRHMAAEIQRLRRELEARRNTPSAPECDDQEEG